MDKTETDFLNTKVLQPFVWLRCIDDIFFIWIHGEAELKKFIEGVINFLPNLQFTYESSKKRVTFLDRNGSITKDLHTKSTNCHHYLHCSSSHPEHIKIPSFIILNTICIYEEEFDKHALNIKS